MSGPVASQSQDAPGRGEKKALHLSVVRPTVGRSKPELRHRLLWLSFLAAVAIPLLLAAWYLYFRANDQYASTVGFSVRTEEISSPVELFGGLAQLSGSSTSDTDILYEFVRSQELVEILETKLGLSRLYAADPADPVFTFREGGTIEDLHDYWLRMTRIDYDPGTGLIEFRALAFAPEDARTIAQAVMDECARIINEITSIAREENIRYARQELVATEDRLKTAREELRAFRSKERIADPEADIQSQMGILSSLEASLAEALISYDILRENTTPGDSRIPLSEQRIRVIESRIADERAKFGGGPGAQQDYSTIIGEYERLVVERTIAEEAYALALAAFHSAQAESRRQSRFLAAHVRPTLAQSSEYPRRLVILGVLGASLVLLWSLGALVYYSVRDRH